MPETLCCWICPACGDRFVVTGPWNEAVEYFLEVAAEHAAGCADCGVDV